jgi:hypothetical protein
MKPGAARIFPVKNHLTLLLSFSSQCWLIKKITWQIFQRNIEVSQPHAFMPAYTKMMPAELMKTSPAGL